MINSSSASLSSLSSSSIKFPCGRRPTILVGGDVATDNIFKISASLTVKGGNITTATDSEIFKINALNRWHRSDPFHILLIVNDLKDQDNYCVASYLREQGYDHSIMLMVSKEVQFIPNLIFDSIISGHEINSSTISAIQDLSKSTEEFSDLNDPDKIIYNDTACKEISDLNLAVSNGNKALALNACRNISFQLPLDDPSLRYLIRKLSSALHVCNMQAAKEYSFSLSSRVKESSLKEDF